jgi:Fe2+ transport system protein FeoA
VKPMTLDQVSNLSKSYVVKDIKKDPLMTKLIDMGLFSGKKIRLLFKAPFGDPIAIDLQGYTLSLRREEAALIAIE